MKKLNELKKHIARDVGTNVALTTPYEWHYFLEGKAIRIIKNSVALLMLFLIMPQNSFASDVVPFSIKRVKPIGSGYVELVGPGEIRIDNKVLPFEETKYVKKANIGTMTSATGSDKGCVLAYSSESYTENILVLDQTCNEILSIFSVVR